MQREIRLEWGQVALAEAARDVTVEVDAGGAHLLRRIVLADEMGNCNGRDVEPIGGLIQARKEFWLETANVAGARIAAYLRCMAGDEAATLVVEVNGNAIPIHPLAKALHGEPNGSLAEYWNIAFPVIEVPAAWLRPGLNRVVFRAEDGSQWEALIEACRFPNRSAKSSDGGRTWDYDHLGYNDCYDGEYLVRLELDRYPEQGRIMSGVVDLAARAGDSLGQPVALRRIRCEVDADLPAGTEVALELRGGPTPAFDPAAWSAWQPAASFLPRPDDRFLQWRGTLRTADPLATPTLRSVILWVVVEGEEAAWGQRAEGRALPLLRPSHPFGYQAPTRRTAMLRERWRLDEVIDGAQDDFDRIIRLANWTRDQWTDGWNLGWKALHFCPPWDGPLILELGRHDLARGMCTHYATVFVQACASLGIPARHVIHHSHCTAEAWTDRWGKWVWIDMSGDMNDETRAVYLVDRGGVPLSALEAHQAWLDGETAGLRLVGRNAERVFTLDRLNLMDRFCIVLRNDQMTSLNPGEPEHGTITYQYDGYLWWRDEKTPPLPRFSLSSSRAADFYWIPNRTAIHLQRTGQAGVLRVDLESSMPNLLALRASVDGREWEDRPARFEWPLHEGANRLAACSVNAFGYSGPQAEAIVQYP